MLITRSYARRLVREKKAVELALASPDGLTDIVTLSRRGGSGRMDWYYPHGVDVRRILGGASRNCPAPHPQMRSQPVRRLGGSASRPPTEGQGRTGVDRHRGRAEGGAAIQELGHAAMWCRATP